MGTMIGGAVQSILQASAVVLNVKLEAPATIRCGHCGLNQFEKESRKDCIRCHRQLRPDPPPPAPPIRILPADPLPEAFGARICIRLKIIREIKAIPQSAVGRAINTPRTYFSKLENGMLVPTVGQLERISRALGITMFELIDESLPAEYIARRSMHRGGEDQNLIAGLIEAMPKLTQAQKNIVLSAAQALHRGQLPFNDWMQV